MNRTYLKRIGAVFITAALIVSMTGCATYDNFKTEFITGESNDVIKIGVFEPMSGTDKEAAAKEIEGIELAYGLHPTAEGKNIELVYADNRSDIDAAQTAIEDLVKKKPAMVLGSYGNANSLVASEYLGNYGIPAITMTNTNPIITSTSSYYFRICFVDTYQGTALAQYVYDDLKAKKAALMVPSNDEQAAVISQKFMNRLISLTDRDSCIAANVEYEHGSEDFSQQLNIIKKSGASVVFLPGSMDDAEKILEQAAEAGLDVTFIGTDSWNIEKLKDMAEDGLKSRVAFTKVSDIEAVDSNNKYADEFFEAYENIYGTDSIPDSACALGYDAYMIAVEALGEAGSDASGRELRDAISRMKYRGASGNITFNSKGDATKSVTIYSLNAKTNETEPVYVVDADGTGSKVKEKRK